MDGMRTSLSFFILAIGWSSCAQQTETMTKQNCDPITGSCTPANLAQSEPLNPQLYAGLEVIYVGDPMCSWCWGISKELAQLKTHQEAGGGQFKIVVGGLRPGGGDVWDNEFKDFLHHHWQEVKDRSGQPFGTQLFELDAFNYDTEPSCRAIVAARPLLGNRVLDFFEAVQHRFYVQNQDPNQVGFYEPICVHYGIDYQAFKTRFESPSVKAETHQEFLLNRQWGVKGYPTVLIKTKEQLFQIANGYATFEQMKEQLEHIKNQQLKP